MVESDIDVLRQKSCVPYPQRLRESHHHICYLMATGMTYTDIAAKTGYSLSRISILANSPAVQEQVAIYRREILKPKIASDVEELKAACGHHLYRMMSDHLHELDAADMLLPFRDICSGIKTIHGNSGQTVNINVGFAARLEQAVAVTRRLESDADA
jgi:hypothetical protein